MGSTWSAADRITASPGKTESPVAEELKATGQTDESNVLDNSELNQLHNQISKLHNEVRELQKNIENLEIQLTLARKQKKQLEQRLADVEQENLELQQLPTKEMGNSVQPNYEVVRDRVLNRLRLGRQSQAGKALDAFIKELLKS
jgi:chromosome segregation ATPase